MKAGMNVIRCNMSHGDHEDRWPIAAGSAMVAVAWAMAGAEHEAGQFGEGLRVGSRVQGQDEGYAGCSWMLVGCDIWVT